MLFYSYENVIIHTFRGIKGNKTDNSDSFRLDKSSYFFYCFYMVAKYSHYFVILTLKTYFFLSWNDCPKWELIKLQNISLIFVLLEDLSSCFYRSWLLINFL